MERIAARLRATVRKSRTFHANVKIKVLRSCGNMHVWRTAHEQMFFFLKTFTLFNFNIVSLFVKLIELLNMILP